MKKLFFLVFVSLLSFSALGVVFAQTDNSNIAGGTPIDLPANGNAFGSSPWDQPGSNAPATPTEQQIQQAQLLQQQQNNCVANGGTWNVDSESCLPSVEACSTAFAGDADKETKCREQHQLCTQGGGSPDRCACKAIGGISLNTNVPFVGNCIALNKSSSSNTTSITDPTNAFPRLLAGLTRIVMTVILIFCFMAIIVGGVLISMGGASEEHATNGKKLIKHVVMALALLGASGVILRAINPNFFG